MVGGLKWYRRDPNRKGRGAGYYYHRGNNEYSKYSSQNDTHKHAKTKIKKGNLRYRHTGDGTYKKSGHGKAYHRANRDRWI